ncbi:MAG: hypothetical protein HFE92_01275 [Acutalibacter muris]|nr:hypothetical protein [Acutalibacter muris]
MDIEIRKVPFMGEELIAARDNEGNIYAGLRWMCEGIGLSEGQSKNERLKIQRDKVLSKGGRNLILPTTGGPQEALCLKLEYIPLWLAKINITPTMERETPELAERLEQYQLKAKDVLAAAFLPQVQPKPQGPHSYPPKSTSAGEVASLLKVLRATMKENKRPAETISRQFELSCKQFGVETVGDFVGHSPFEQLTICLIEGGPI